MCKYIGTYLFPQQTSILHSWKRATELGTPCSSCLCKTYTFMGVLVSHCFVSVLTGVADCVCAQARVHTYREHTLSPAPGCTWAQGATAAPQLWGWWMEQPLCCWSYLLLNSRVSLVKFLTSDHQYDNPAHPSQDYISPTDCRTDGSHLQAVHTVISHRFLSGDSCNLEQTGLNLSPQKIQKRLRGSRSLNKPWDTWRWCFIFFWRK